MGIFLRKSGKFGPFRLNFTQNGYSSWGIKVGPWSWNSRTRRNSVDLPGPFRWQQRRKGGRS